MHFYSKQELQLIIQHPLCSQSSMILENIKLKNTLVGVTFLLTLGNL